MVLFTGELSSPLGVPCEGVVLISKERNHLSVAGSAVGNANRG